MTLSSTPSLPSQEALNDLKKALRPNATIIGAITLSWSLRPCEPTPDRRVSSSFGLAMITSSIKRRCVKPALANMNSGQIFPLAHGK